MSLDLPHTKDLATNSKLPGYVAANNLAAEAEDAQDDKAFDQEIQDRKAADEMEKQDRIAADAKESADRQDNDTKLDQKYSKLTNQIIDECKDLKEGEEKLDSDKASKIMLYKWWKELDDKFSACVNELENKKASKRRLREIYQELQQAIQGLKDMAASDRATFNNQMRDNKDQLAKQEADDKAELLQKIADAKSDLTTLITTYRDNLANQEASDKTELSQKIDTYNNNLLAKINDNYDALSKQETSDKAEVLQKLVDLKNDLTDLMNGYRDTLAKQESDDKAELSNEIDTLGKNLTSQIDNDRETYDQKLDDVQKAMISKIERVALGTDMDTVRQAVEMVLEEKGIIPATSDTPNVTAPDKAASNAAQVAALSSDDGTANLASAASAAAKQLDSEGGF